MSTQITEHFTLEEFACHDGTPYPQEWVADRLTPLCQMLEVVRAAASAKFGHDAPMHTLCGYRTEAYNQHLIDTGHGAASGSQHQFGRATDTTMFSLPPANLHALFLELYRAGKIPALGGLGIYPGWVHADIRERVNGHLSQWGSSS